MLTSAGPLLRPCDGRGRHPNGPIPLCGAAAQRTAAGTGPQRFYFACCELPPGCPGRVSDGWRRHPIKRRLATTTHYHTQTHTHTHTHTLTLTHSHSLSHFSPLQNHLHAGVVGEVQDREGGNISAVESYGSAVQRWG